MASECDHLRTPDTTRPANNLTQRHCAKTWVFDDRFAIIGSANCNRRSSTHDSEIAVGIFDENRTGDRLTFAHRLRMDLWLRALNKGPAKGIPSHSYTDADVADFVRAASLWHAPAPDATIEPYDVDPAHSPAADPVLDTSIMTAVPSRLYGLPTAPLIPPIVALRNEWDTFIDPDGS